MRRRATWQLRRLGLVLCLVASIVVGFSGGASAHTELTQSYPAAGQVIEGSVGSVDLTFTDVIVPELSQLVVRDKAGRNLAVGRPSSFGSRLSSRLAGAEARGAYRVTYRVVAADGHPVVGSFRFAVRSGADSGSRLSRRGWSGPGVDGHRAPDVSDGAARLGPGRGGHRPGAAAPLRSAEGQLMTTRVLAAPARTVRTPAVWCPARAGPDRVLPRCRGARPPAHQHTERLRWSRTRGCR